MENTSNALAETAKTISFEEVCILWYEAWEKGENTSIMHWVGRYPQYTCDLFLWILDAVQIEMAMIHASEGVFY